MKKIIFKIILLIGVVGSIVLFFAPTETKAANGTFGGGDGVAEETPYLIEDCDDLQAINNDRDAYYQITQDIDCSETSSWNGGHGFIPIGTGSAFTGVLNGNNYTISNLTVSTSSARAAMFAAVMLTGTVQNFTIHNASISGTGSVAIISGYMYEGIIDSITVTSSTLSASNTYAGCLAGYAQNSALSNIHCSNTTINSTVSGAAITGGLLGYMYAGVLRYASFQGTIYAPGAYRVAGIAGYAMGSLENFEVDQVSTNVTITADGSDEGIGGGFALLGTGVFKTGTVTDISVIATINTESPISGFTSMFANSGALTINRTYAAVSSTSTGLRYGYVYDATSGGTVSVSNSFWDSDLIATTTGWGDSSYTLTGGITGKTTSEMKALATYTDTDTVGLTGAWDFVGNHNNDSGSWSYWNLSNSINSGYPYLTTVYANLSPTAPSSLGSSSYVNGSKGNDNTPTVSFTLADENIPDTVKFRIQIDDTASFASPVVDYTSALATQGSSSFTVGQSVGSGTYTVGSAGQTLTDGSYYWRVQTIDSSTANSSYSTANSGAVAFIVDTTAPTISLIGSASVEHSAGETYTDAGATASDSLDGDVTNNLTVSGSVDINTPGSYTLTYSVSDTVGNAATAVTRTVTVVASGSGIAIIAPTAIDEDFRISINGSTADPFLTFDPRIVIGFNANSNTVKGFAVSKHQDFQNATIQPYQTNTEVLVTNPTTTLFVKFFSMSGHESPVFKKNITYSPTTTVKAPVTETQTNTNPSIFSFTRNLSPGMSGPDVLELQKFLNTKGFTVSQTGAGSPGQETQYYGPATTKSLINFQEAYAKEILNPIGLGKGTGLLFNSTRLFINKNIQQ